MVAFPSDKTRGQDPMSRFLNEGGDEQPAIFIRPDNDNVSIDKGCICGTKAEQKPKL